MSEAIFFENIFNGSFAAGVMIGGMLVYGVVASGHLPTPMVVDLKTKLAAMQSKLEQTERELVELRDEMKQFIDWRRDLTDQNLRPPKS